MNGFSINGSDQTHFTNLRVKLWLLLSKATKVLWRFNCLALVCQLSLGELATNHKSIPHCSALNTLVSGFTVGDRGDLKPFITSDETDQWKQSGSWKTFHSCSLCGQQRCLLYDPSQSLVAGQTTLTWLRLTLTLIGEPLSPFYFQKAYCLPIALTQHHYAVHSVDTQRTVST